MIRSSCHTARSTAHAIAFLVGSLIIGTSPVTAAIIGIPSVPQPASSTAPAPASDAPSIILPGQQSPPANLDRTQLTNRANEGDVEAMLMLAWDHYAGQSGRQSLVTARRWFKAASEREDPRGMLAYGYFLAQGLGGARNISQARELYEAAEEFGIVRAIFLRSQLEGSLPSAKRRLQARQLLERAARAGDPIAWNTLGVEFELEGNITMAKRSYTQGIQAGNAISQNNLDRITQGTRYARQAALLELQARAEERNPEALFELAQHYHRGQDVQRDFNRAFRNYQAAAALGHQGANEMVQLILSRPSSDPRLPFDSAWMQSLSSHALVMQGTRLGEGRQMTPQRNPDPLEGLLLPPGMPWAVLPIPSAE